MAFERDAIREYPGLHSRIERRGRGRRDEVVYRLVLDVPTYPSRHVTIRLYNDFEPIFRCVIADDGPTESFHRYTKRTLCLWKADAPPEERWTVDDGLPALLRIIRAHLFEEEWARQEGEWAGPEIPHRRFPIQQGTPAP